MRKLLLHLLIFFCTAVYAQNNDLISQMKGFKHNNGIAEFEISGYSIYTMHKYEAFNKKEIKNILTDCGIKNIVTQYSDTTFDRQNLVIKSKFRSQKNCEMTGYTLLYIFPQEKQSYDIVIFQTLLPLNIELCRQFLKAYLANDFKKYIIKDKGPYNVDFIGRNIELGYKYQWLSPNNLKCGEQGQMSWSTFGNLDDAKEYIRLCIAENSVMKSVLTEHVDVLFEDVSTTATRIVYKNEDGWSSKLAAYYVVAKVRDTYVGCVVSHYINNDEDYNLSPLLQKVMTLEGQPIKLSKQQVMAMKDQPVKLSEQEDGLDDLKAKNCIPVYDREYGDGFEDSKRMKFGFIMVHTGVWIPLGQMQNVIGISPSFGARWMWLLPEASRFSFGFGFDMMILTNRKQSNLHADGTMVQTKANSISAMGAIYIGYDHRLTKNLYLDQYLGLGSASFDMNQKDGGVDNNGNDTYYSNSAFNLCLGGRLRYKSFGVFAEYHYIPFKQPDKLDRSFGNNTIMAGLSWRF